MTTIWKRGVSVAAAAVCAALTVTGAVKAEDKKFTVAVIMPSLDISYWQWVAYGAKTKAQDLGMNYMELKLPQFADRADENVRTAITKGANAIVIGPVSSTSTPPVLRYLKEQNIPVAFTGIGPQPGQTDYTSSVTANNEASGQAEGKYVCQLAKERGGNKVGMLSLPQDRENAQKYLRGRKRPSRRKDATSFKSCRPRALFSRGGQRSQRPPDRASRHQGYLRHV